MKIRISYNSVTGSNTFSLYVLEHEWICLLFIFSDSIHGILPLIILFVLI